MPYSLMFGFVIQFSVNITQKYICGMFNVYVSILYIRPIKETNFYSYNNITVGNQIITPGIYNFPGDYTNIQMPILPKKTRYEFYIVSNTRCC